MPAASRSGARPITPTARHGSAANVNGVAAPWRPRAIEPPADEQERDPERQREHADGGRVGRVVADLLEPARAEVAPGVDDLARRRIDQVAGGLERLGRLDAEEGRRTGRTGSSKTFSVSSSTVNQSAMSPEPRKNGRPLPGPIR